MLGSECSARKDKEGSIRSAFLSENCAPMRLKSAVSEADAIAIRLKKSTTVIFSFVMAIALAVIVALALNYRFLGHSITISAITADVLLIVVSAGLFSAATIKTRRNQLIAEKVHEFNETKKHGEEEEITMLVKPAVAPRISVSCEAVTAEEKLRYEASALLVKRARDSLQGKITTGASEIARIIHDPFLERDVIVRKNYAVGDLEISSIYFSRNGKRKTYLEPQGIDSRIIIKVPTWFKGVTFVPDKVHYGGYGKRRGIHPRCVVDLESRDGIWSVITGGFDNSWGVSDSRRMVRGYVLYQRIFLNESLARVQDSNGGEIKNCLISTGSAADLIRYGDCITRALQDPYPRINSSTCGEEIERRRAFLQGMELEDIPDHLRSGTPLNALKVLCVLSHSHDALLKELTLVNQTEIIIAFLSSPCLGTFIVQRILEGLLVVGEHGNWQIPPSYDDIPRVAMCIPGLCDNLRVFAENILKRPDSRIDDNFMESAISATSQVSFASTCPVVELTDGEVERQPQRRHRKNLLKENEKRLSRAMFLCAASVIEGVSFSDIETREEYGEYREIAVNYIDRCHALKEIVTKLVEGIYKDGWMDCTKIGYLVELAASLQVRFMFQGVRAARVLLSVAREDSAESMARVLYESLHCGKIKEDLYRVFSSLLNASVDVPTLLPSGSIDLPYLSLPYRRFSTSGIRGVST
ncbi:hypothetical protein [Anaplasma platys]|nr:hypothetical protein [Anaplasma platys]